MQQIVKRKRNNRLLIPRLEPYLAKTVDGILLEINSSVRLAVPLQTEVTPISYIYFL